MTVFVSHEVPSGVCECDMSASSSRHRVIGRSMVPVRFISYLGHDYDDDDDDGDCVL